MYDSSEFLNTIFGGMNGAQGVDAYGKNVAAAAAQGAALMGQSGMGLTQSYLNDYQPYDKKFMGYVDNLGTDAYRSQQRGQAMTSVQQQIDAQRQQTGRQMAAMGINPNSGRFASVQSQMDMQGALAKAQAAAASDKSVRGEWANGLGAINAMGLKVGELGSKNMLTASELGKLGLAGADAGASAMDRQTNAGANATSAGASAQNAANGATKLAMEGMQFDKNYGLELGKLALGRARLDHDGRVATANQESGSFGNTTKNLIVGAGMKYLENNGIDGAVKKVKSYFSPSFQVDETAAIGNGQYYNNDPETNGW